jgi:peptidoglycan/xylan/chitin deacetylase (PgdA/CDA1 family)
MAIPIDANPIDVCITIDTEFSIGGAFDDPCLAPVADPVVCCPAGGREHGLAFLLEVFERFGLKATFFVEALNAAWFGPDAMGSHARLIHARGHDVQLHLHPCWLHFRRPDWRSDLSAAAINDSCSGRAPAELAEMLEYGLRVFAEWGLPRPIALRTGNLQVDSTVHAVMAEFGLTLSSSVGLAHRQPEEKALRLTGGIRRFGPVAEVPVLSFGQRLFTIAGTGEAEARAVLVQARAKGASPVVVLTHPFEFVKVGDDQFTRLRPNRITQRRLRALAAFLAAHPSDFRVTTFRDAAERWLKGEVAAPDLSAPLLPGVARMLTNGLNDRLWWL